jgi:hypothetical protein
MNTDDLNRFWSKVDKTSNPLGCWEWINPGHPFGYGRFGFDKKNYLAHRLSYQIHYGPITSKDCVLHKCDNPQCVNPQHLFLGSRTLNAQDRTNKGRTYKGSQVTNSKFTEQQVLAIRSSSKTIRQLATEYSTDYGHMWQIVKRKTWRHI